MLSLGLFLANGSVIRWGDSFRGYAVASATILLAYAAVWRVIEKCTTTSILIAALAAVASVHFMFQNAVLVAVVCASGIAAAVYSANWRAGAAIAVIGLFAAASLLPYIPTVSRYRSLNVLLPRVYDVSAAMSSLLRAMTSGSVITAIVWVVALVCAFVVGCQLLATPGRDRQHGALHVFHFAVLITTLPAFIAFSRAARMQINPWHCLVALGILVMAMEFSIQQVTTTFWLGLVRASASVAVAIAVIVGTISDIRVRQTNVDVISQRVGRQSGEHDLVIVNPWFYALPFDHYYQGLAPRVVLPPIGRSSVHRYDLLMQRMAMSDPNRSVLDGIEHTLMGGRRVWLVGRLETPGESEEPPYLPPAPNAPHGWYTGDYVRAWTLQLGAFLRQHRVEVVPVDLGLDAVSDYETATLYLLTGWKL